MEATTPFVGRAAELDALTTALRDAGAGNARIVFVEGAAGIGKTTLALELVARAEREGVRSGVGRAWEGAGAPTWFVWREALRAVDGDAAELAFPRTIANEEARFAAIERLAGHVRTLATPRPLLLVLDDLQWADAASLLALKLVARTSRGAHLLVVATVRAPSQGEGENARLLDDVRREATVIALPGLREQDLAELARARGVTRDDAGAVLLDVTAGNPLYAAEVLRERAALAALAAGATLPLPRSAVEMLEQHLAKLAPEDRAVVASAALGPQPGRLVELARATGASRDEAARAVDRAIAAGVLAPAPEGRYRFAHDILRAAARETIPRSEMKARHEAWADALRELGDERSVERAHHLLAADEAGTALEAATAATAAARVARGRFDYESAATLLERAASTHDRAGRRREAAEALALLAHARFDAGDPNAGVATAERAVALSRRLGEPGPLARAALALGRRRVLAMPDPPLASVLDEALAALAASKGVLGLEEVALQCRLEARLASALQPAADADRALALARRAIARARDTGDRELYAHVLHSARPAFRMLDDLDERLAIDRELLDLAERLDDEFLAADAHARLLREALEAGDAVLVDRHLTAYARLGEKLGLADHVLGVASARAMQSSMRGDFAEAQARLAELERTRAAWGPQLTAAPPIDPLLMLRFSLATASGDRQVFAHMASLVATAPIPMAPVRATFAALFSARAGELERARAPYEEAAQTVALRGITSYFLWIALGEVCAILGDRGSAGRFYEHLRPFAGRHVVWAPNWCYDGSVDRVLGALAAVEGRATIARAHLVHAVAAEEALGAHAFAARSRRERDALALGAPSSTRAEGREAPSARTSELTLVEEGDVWQVSRGAEQTRVRGTDGLHYLAYLIARPDVPVAAMELFASISRRTDGDALPPSNGDAGEVLDARAIGSYRARAADLEAELADARRRNDIGAADAVHRELAFLEAELTRAVGLGGRSRRAGSDAERVRVNVTMRIRKAIAKIREHAPGIADHLARSVRTGATCIYSPPRDART